MKAEYHFDFRKARPNPWLAALQPGDTVFVIGWRGETRPSAKAQEGKKPSPRRSVSIAVGVRLWNRFRRKHPDIRLDFEGLDLSERDLSGYDLSRLDLTGVLLDGANLEGSHLSGSNLSGVRLRHANLTGADLTGAILRGADLTGADLTDAELSGADLTDSLMPSEAMAPMTRTGA
jgi:hypothetical protein